MIAFIIIQLSLALFNFIWYGKGFLQNHSAGRFFLTIVPLFFILTSTFQLIKAIGIQLPAITVSNWAAVILGIGTLCSSIQAYYAIREII